MRLSRLAVLTLCILSAPVLAASAVTASSSAVSSSGDEPASIAPIEVSAPTLMRHIEATRAELPTVDVNASPEVSLGHVVKLAFQAIGSRNWSLLGCAIVLGLVYLVRRLGARRLPWLSSDAAGVGLSLIAAVALQVSTAVAAGAPATPSMVFGALLTAAGASGLFSWGKKLRAAHQYATGGSRE